MHFLFRPLPHVTSTPPWLLRPMRVSTSSELYPNTWLFFVFECIGIQFFNSLTCDLQDAMPCQRPLTLFLLSNPVIPHSLVDYRQVFKPILYVQPSPAQSDLRLYPTHFLSWVLRIWESFFYSQVFFTLHFLYLGKQRISLGVTIILSMHLCPHT